MKAKSKILIVITVLGLVFIGIAFGIIVWVGKEKNSFVGQPALAISPVHWEFTTLNARVLWKFNKSGGNFVKVIYADELGGVKIADVFLGGKLNNVNVGMIKTDVVWKFGQKVKIDYLTGKKFGEVSQADKDEFCGRVGRICILEDLVDKGVSFIPALAIYEK